MFLFTSTVFAQEDGIRIFSNPIVHNFSDKEYDGYIQNWDIAQDSSGFIYIANLGKILQYDGTYWKGTQVDNNRALSITEGKGGKLYIGGVGSFGYLDKSDRDTAITPEYHSLIPLLPDSNVSISNVWNVLPHGESVFFQQKNALFHLKEGQINIFKPQKQFFKSYKVNDKVLISDVSEGHYTVGDEMSFWPNSDKLAGRKVMVMLPYKEDTWLVADLTEGLSLFDGDNVRKLESEVDEFLIENKVYAGIELPDGSYLFGTLNGGIVQVDKEGRLLRKIDNNTKLQSNQVHSLFLDEANNIWAALGNGLSLIEVLSPISYLDERNGIAGTVIDIEVQGDYLYASTTEGLFRLHIYDYKAGVRSKFETLLDKSIRCEKISSYNNQLLVDCGNRIYRVFEGTEIELFEEKNIRIISRFTQRNNYYVLSRNSFQIFNSNHKPVFVNNEFGYEVISSVEEEDGDLWIATVSNGVFRIESDFFESFDNFDSHLHHYEVPHNQDDQALRVFNISGEAVIGSSAGLYHYDVESDSLVPDHRFGEEMADTERQVFLMEEDANGNIYVRSNREHQILLKEEDGYRYTEAGLKRIDANQVNRIYTHESGLVWMASNEGIIQYDSSMDPFLDPEYEESYNAHVREVRVRGDSLINADLNNRGYELEYKDNELRFQYSATYYKESSKIRYQVKLEGFEENWSSWTPEVQKDYTNIPEGSYTFKVRAKNVYDSISEIDTFSFTVLPPWYRSWWAYSLYVVLIGGLLYGLHKIRINRLMREHRIRNRIASDLHDEVSATLSSISYFAQAIRQVSDEKQSERFVDLISESAGDAKEKITDIIWSIDPEKDSWVDLLSKCRRFASDLFESKGMEYELNIESDINKPLDIELRQHLWLIFKELVVNAARHSEADRVEVQLGMQQNTLELRVRDNGIGLEKPLDQYNGKGLKSIRDRVEKIGADLELHNSDKGTFWLMTLDM
ncbi:sensor histidine kinase [Fodinibius saliphilus]|uniref:sensor histidine kinase n=1 Tax=Fodinibius saliphilus TaxID=1920650 RepID=UPI0014861F13|nr:ATP-binding protein [Fodinibius saliphilus]